MRLAADSLTEAHAQTGGPLYDHDDPENKRDVLDLLIRKIGVSPAEANVLYASGVPIFARGSINRRNFDSTIASYARIGLLKEPLPTYGDMVFDFVK